MMLKDILFQTIKDEPDAGITFIDEQGNRQRLTYMEIGYRAKQRFEFLSISGLKAHDFVMFQMYDDMDFVINFWACMFGGFVPVFTNPSMGFDVEAQESKVLQFVDNHLDHPWILISEAYKEIYQNYAKAMGFKGSQCVFTQSTDPIEIGMENPVPDENFLELDETCMMFFTSGTTGMPKCVPQSNAAAVAREKAVAEYNHFKKDVSLNWMPLEHAGGILMAHLRAVLSKSEQVQVQKGYILQKPLRWIDLMSEFHVGYSWAPHFAFILINKAMEGQKDDEDWDLSSVTFLLDGGEMVEATSGKAFMENLAVYGLKDGVIHPSWGMAETCSGVMYNPNFKIDQAAGVQKIGDRTYTEIGEPIPGYQIRIVDEHNVSLPDEQIGIFQLKGPSVTRGYYRNSDANQEAFTDDGWFSTGDMGFISDGRVTLTGRDKDVVIFNGLNYSSAEIESVIDGLVFIRHSYVAVGQCINDQGIEETIAFFTPNDHVDPIVAADQVIKAVHRELHLPLAKAIPVTSEQISKSNLGKIQRSKILKAYLAGEFSNAYQELKNWHQARESNALPEWTYCEKLVTEPIRNHHDQKMSMTIDLEIDDTGLKKSLENELLDVTGIGKQTTVIFQGEFLTLQNLGRNIALGKVACDHLVVLTQGLYDSTNAGDPQGEVLGYCRCLEAEMPHLNCQVIDFCGEMDYDRITQKMVKEVRRLDKSKQLPTIVYFGDDRKVVKLEKAELKNVSKGFTYGGLVLMTGGAGGIGRYLCQYLLNVYASKIVMIGRRSSTDPSVQEFLNTLTKSTGQYHYESCDVTDEKTIESIIQKYEKKYHTELSEIIHAAGLGNVRQHLENQSDRMIKKASSQLYDEMLKAKKTGSQILYQIAAHREKTHLIIFGSTNGFFGSASFSAYSAANSFPSIFAMHHGERPIVQAFNFSTWRDTGMSRGIEFGKIGQLKGFFELTPVQGLMSIEDCLKTEKPSLYIGLAKTGSSVKSFMVESESTAVQHEQSKRAEPLTDLQMHLASIWESILKVPVCASNDDFFELGGDSIKSFALPKAIQDKFGIDYSLRDVFRCSRLNEMAEQIRQRTE